MCIPAARRRRLCRRIARRRVRRSIDLSIDRIFHTAIPDGSVCNLAADPVEVSTTTSLDTDSGISSPAGLTCSRVASGATDICALVASAITIEPAIVLSAHGSRALALFAHSITVRGTIDVASHINGATGAGSSSGGCLAGTLPRGFGEGRGGNSTQLGGQGGDDGSTAATDRYGRGTVVGYTLTGGCRGTRGGDGSTSGGSDDGL